MISVKEIEDKDEKKESKWKTLWRMIPSLPFFAISAYLAALKFFSDNQQDLSGTFSLSNGVTLAVLFGVVAAIVPNFKALIDQFKSLRYSLKKRIIPRAELSQQFAEVFDQVLCEVRNKGKILVLAIDNLDRCEPDVVVEMLSMIKTFMNFELCKYIISCDNIAIERYLASAKSLTDLAGPYPREFLKKFFQVTINVPPFNPGDLTDYADGLLLTTPLKSSEGVSEILVAGTIKNPRKIHQYINNLVVLHKLATARELERILPVGFVTNNPKFLAKIIVLREEFPEFYRSLEVDEGVLEDVEDYLKGQESKSKKLPDEITNMIDKDQNLQYFLRTTFTVSSGNISSFLSISQEKFQSALPDIGIFRNKIRQGDMDYINSKLQGDDKIRSEYFKELLSYIKGNLLNSRFLYASNGIASLIENYGPAPRVMIPIMKPALEEFLQNQAVLLFVQKYNYAYTLNISEDFSESSRFPLLYRYSQIVATAETIDFILLKQLGDHFKIIPDHIVDIINDNLAANLKREENIPKVFSILSEDEKTKKKFIRDPLLESIVSKVTTEDLEKSKSYIEMYLSYKDCASQHIKDQFGLAIMSLLNLYDADVIMRNYLMPLSGWQKTGCEAIFKLGKEDFPSSAISDRIFDLLDEIRSKIWGFFSGRKPAPDEQFEMMIIRMKLAVFNGLSSTKRESFVNSELRQIISSKERLIRTIDYAKIHNSKILEYDSVIADLSNSIDIYDPLDTRGIEFMFASIPTGKSEVIIAALTDMIRLRQSDRLRRIIEAINKHVDIIPNSAVNALTTSIEEVVPLTPESERPGLMVAISKLKQFQSSS